MRRRTAVALALLASGCHRNHGGFIEGSETRIDLTLAFPVNGAATDFAGVCATARSLLVSLDTDSDPAWDYRLLIDPATGDLWGCPGGRCADPSVHGLLPAPHRVLVEGLSVDPGQYATPHDVVCRGIADVSLGMGSISVDAPPPSPTPTPSGGDVVKTLVSVRVPMLPVGDLAGTFTNEVPTGRLLAATALDPLPAARTASGGTLVFGGGIDPGTGAASPAVYEFRPAGISFHRDGQLQVARYAATATAFTDTSGAAVLFAGGAIGSADAIANAEIWRPGAAVTTVVQMHAARAFHAASLLDPAPPPGGAAIAITAGCASDRSSPLADTETFSPSLPTPPPSACLSAPAGFCAVAGADLPTGRCHLLSALTDAGIWLAGGFVDAGGPPATDSFLLPVESPPPVAAGALPQGLADGAAITTGPGRAVFAGGATSADGVTASAAFGDLRVGRVPAVREDAQMLVPRVAPTLTRLADGRLMVAGGSNEIGQNVEGMQTVEFFAPTASTLTDGTFAFAMRPGATNCNNGTSGGCVRMAARRVAHSALRIEGSATWLEGAVVIAGGDAGTPPEIFVPAYACSGISPIDTFGGVITDADFCDRARDPSELPLTDPSAPAAF